MNTRATDGRFQGVLSVLVNASTVPHEQALGFDIGKISRGHEPKHRMNAQTFVGGHEIVRRANCLRNDEYTGVPVEEYTFLPESRVE